MTSQKKLIEEQLEGAKAQIAYYEVELRKCRNLLEGLEFLREEEEFESEKSQEEHRRLYQSPEELENEV